MRRRIVGRNSVALMALAALAANSCSAAAPTSPTTSTIAGPQTFARFMMIEEGHAVPAELTIAVGERVTFMNHDRATYTIVSRRAPSVGDCPEIDVVGMLSTGETRDTDAFTTAKTCEFRVSENQSALLTGRIIIR